MAKYISPWIFTTNNCNLNCGYCYVKRNKTDMTQNVYTRVNDLFLGMINENKVDMVIYRLAGGEPLLVFDKWKDHVAYFLETAKEKGFVSLITNLTILTDEMIEYFLKYNIGYGISLDGYNFSKPYLNGKSSANNVMNNIDKLLNKEISKNIDISTVIDKNSFDSIEKLAHWIGKRNLNWGCYLDHYFCGEIETEIIVNSMKNVIDILNSYNYDIYEKFKFNNIKLTSKYEGCTAGEKLIAVDVKGDIYPCQTAIYGDKICSIFDKPELIDSLKAQKKYKLGYNYRLPSDCEQCSIASMCGGGCKLNNKEINRNYTCDIMKQVILKIANVTLKKEVYYA